MSLRSFLEERGAPEEAIAAAEAEGPHALRALALECVFLGGPARYDSGQVSAAAM